MLSNYKMVYFTCRCAAGKTINWAPPGVVVAVVATDVADTVATPDWGVAATDAEAQEEGAAPTTTTAVALLSDVGVDGDVAETEATLRPEDVTAEPKDDAEDTAVAAATKRAFAGILIVICNDAKILYIKNLIHINPCE